MSMINVLKKSAAALAAVCTVLACSGGRTESTLEMDNLPLVFENNDVVFHQLDEHTWVGNGHQVYNESVYIVEGEDRALLIDAGTWMPHLDKVVAKITDKPVTLALTHNHIDHVGAAKFFDELWIGNAGGEQDVHGFDGTVNYLEDHQVIDLGGRTIEVFNAPGHTEESVLFIDKAAHYAFSGDAFGSTNLLMTLDVSTFVDTARKTLEMMQEQGIEIMYPGHFAGTNPETQERVSDLLKVSTEVLEGKLEGEAVTGGMGLDRVVNYNGVKFNYNSSKVK